MDVQYHNAKCLQTRDSNGFLMNTENLPFSHPSQGGSGGNIKTAPSDFQVEEVPAYPFQGNGEHLFVLIEKNRISTHQVIMHIRQILHLSPKQIGYAGRKDALAVSRQWLSLHSREELPIHRVENEYIRILETTRHKNKLRIGHLSGNKFKIVVRNIQKHFDPVPITSLMNTKGFPNYYGNQRLGENFKNARRGQCLVAESKSRKIKGNKSLLDLNAFQSALFNELIALRLLLTGSLHKTLVGDLAQIHKNHAVFQITDNNADSSAIRCIEGEISPSAPLFGHAKPLASLVPGKWERKLLELQGMGTQAPYGLTDALPIPGERRPVREFPRDLHIGLVDRPEGKSLNLSFELPRGVFATSLLREITKSDSLTHFLSPEEWKQFLQFGKAAIEA